jgi:Fic family protein
MPTWDVRFDMRVDVNYPKIVYCVAQAEALASVIRDIPIPPPAKQRIDALNIMRAVRGTTGIEGTELTEEEVREIMEAAPGQQVLPATRAREEQEARNAQDVMLYIVDLLDQDSSIPLTEELICEIHRIITENIDYPNNVPGNYRNHAVSAGSYILPRSGSEVERLMKGFVDWFNGGEPASWHPVVKAVVAHFYVVSIHPFGDGNGRAARAVESFLLYQAKINARGFYSLSNHYYRNRDQYMSLLDEVRFRTNNDLTPFLLFSLCGLVDELQVVHKEVMNVVQIISFRDLAREQLQGKRANKAGERIWRLLFGLKDETVSLKDLRTGQHSLSSLYRELNPKTLSRDLRFLQDENLVVVNGDELRANVDVMSIYTPPYEFRIQALRRKRDKSRRSAPID